MADYGLQLKEWQLSAQVILVKMNPQPGLRPAPFYNYWQWSPRDGTASLTWSLTKSVPEDIYRYLPYQIGDRIYHQEEWTCVVGIGDTLNCVTRSVCENCTDEWRSANTMPPEAATVWREITEVKMLQAETIEFDDYHPMGLSDYHLGPMTTFDPVMQVQPRMAEIGVTEGKDWVIALTVKEAADA